MTNPVIRLLDLWSLRYARASSRQTASTLPATLITGASEGLGLAIARRFAKAGHRVVLVARHEQMLVDAAKSIKQDFGVDAEVLTLDINLADAGRQIEAYLLDRNLHAEILINNAGFGLAGIFANIPNADIDALVSCNISALTRLTRHFLPSMIARQSGAIVNVASLAALTPGPFQAAYYASKAYVLSLTRALAFESRGRGVKIAVVTPGPIETRFHSRMGANHSLYRYLVPTATAEQVADATYRGLRWHRSVIVPGFAAKIVDMLLRFVPAPAVIPIVALLAYPRASSTQGPPANPTGDP